MLIPLPTLPVAIRFPSRRGRGKPRRRRVVLLAVLAVVLLVGLVCWVRLRARPSWYVPPDPRDIATQDQAQDAQNRILGLHNKVEDALLGPQVFTLTEDEVNSFLAVSFQRIPREEGGSGGGGGAVKAGQVTAPPMVHFTPGHVTLAVRMAGLPGSGGGGGVASIELAVKVFPPDARHKVPSGLVTLEHVRVGSFPVPSSFLKDRLNAGGLDHAIAQLATVYAPPSAARSLTAQLSAALDASLHDQPFPLSFSNGHRRHIDVQAVDLTPGQLEITFVPSASTPRLAPPPSDLSP